MKLPITYCLLLVIYSFQYAYAQKTTPEIDSLLKVIDTAKTLSEKAKNYNDVAWAYLDIDLNLAKSYLDTSYTIRRNIKDEEGIAISKYGFGVLYRKNGEYEKALRYLNAYYQYAIQQKDTFNIANSAYQKGVVYSDKGDYKKGLEQYYLALTFYEDLNDKKSIGFVSNTIGVLQKNLKDYPKAINSYKRAIKIHEELKNLSSLSNAHSNLANVYSLQGNYDLALKNHKKSLQLDTQTNNVWGVAINYVNMGSLMLKKNQCHDALKNLDKANKLQLKHGFKKEQLETIFKLGEAYLCLKDYRKSEHYLKEALLLKPESKSINQTIQFNLYKLYSEIENSKKALFHYKKYTAYKDSIYQQKNLKSINDLQIKYESKIKDEEIARQQLALNLKENTILKKQSEFHLALLGGSLFLILSLGIWLFYKQQEKLKNKRIETLTAQKELNKLEALIDGEEKERKRIAQDLHDGINGDLSAIKYKFTSVNQDKFIQKEKKEYTEAINMLDRVIEQVRHISQNLVPPSLQSFNLIEALQQFCSKISNSNPTKINFQYYGAYVKLSKEAETAIYRIIQELVTNIVKHAQATKALVQVNIHNENMHITVEDNGIGFNSSKDYKGLGLKNIESRIAFLNADLFVETNSNGTSFTIDINTKNLKDD
ncbi:tetratricopeptide repeat-containing sensor histidine kinase [Gelatiniphilus marinus]|uniref:histidine kinase n=1 Tax=Gelatiniphilus marinus TaxID=1759464 RepID=A0ABW5JSR9_9FLAO